MANANQLEILKQGVEIWNKSQSMTLTIKGKITISRHSHRPEERSGSSEIPIEFTPKGADLSDVDLSGIDLNSVFLSDANLIGANLSKANLCRANLHGANFTGANLRAANLSDANLIGANFLGADLSEADLMGANLSRANIIDAHLNKANLQATKLIAANLNASDLTEANLYKADLNSAALIAANLTGADLRETNLTGANLVKATVGKAKLSGSSVYAVNVWDLKGEFEEQRDLIITEKGDPTITVDNIKVVQFIYLILNNEEIRDVLNTLTSKSVLILGRFAIPERKSILDALRNKLREHNLLPIVFDFDRPTDKDFTETIKTLAGLCYFVIADVTNPKSSPLELQATVPDYQIPFVPIIQDGENPFAMMVDLQQKYNWVLPTVTYDSMETLIKVLKPLIIDPAMKKRQELRIIKAKMSEVISGKDFLEKGKV